MCNEYARRISPDRLREGWGAPDAALLFPEGPPNMPELDSIRITEPAIILRASSVQAGAAEVVTRRWSWPAPNGKPVYNFRSDGREFENKPTSGRCLIPADAFYEFTDDIAPSTEGAGRGQALSGDLFGVEGRPSPKRAGKKTKWAFRTKGLDWFGIAGLWRADAELGEAWTMLTTAPGPDIAPYHDRQIVLLTPADYRSWLDGSAPANAVCRPLPAGTLEVERVR